MSSVLIFPLRISVLHFSFQNIFISPIILESPLKFVIYIIVSVSCIRTPWFCFKFWFYLHLLTSFLILYASYLMHTYLSTSITIVKNVCVCVCVALCCFIYCWMKRGATIPGICRVTDGVIRLWLYCHWNLLDAIKVPLDLKLEKLFMYKCPRYTYWVLYLCPNCGFLKLGTLSPTFC